MITTRHGAALRVTVDHVYLAFRKMGLIGLAGLHTREVLIGTVGISTYGEKMNQAEAVDSFT